MTEFATDGAPAALTEATPTIVWIDSREAFLATWVAGEAAVERVESEVPIHHRSTGHVRHDPMIRHGGGGREQTAGEPHRQEHIERFVKEIADRLDRAGPVVVVGTGTVREHLERELRDRDARMRRVREVATEPARPMTEPQLVARLRHLVHADPPRRTVGAYRWSVPMAQQRSGRPVGRPRRVAPKLPAEPAEED